MAHWLVPPDSTRRGGLAYGVDPLVIHLWEAMRREDISTREVTIECGFGLSTMGRWFRGESVPNISNLTAAFDYLGYAIILERKPGP